MKTFLSAFAGFAATSRHDIHVRSCRRTQNSIYKEKRYDDSGEGDGRIQHIGDDSSMSRRSLLHSVGLSIAGTVSSGPTSALLRYAVSTDAHQNVNAANNANAIGLVQFPCKPGSLANTYHMMRAGESGLEAEGILR